MEKQRPWVIGFTGASGALYGVRLCQCLLDQGHHIHLLITDAGWRVLKEELGWDVTRRSEALSVHFAGRAGTYDYHPIQDIGGPTASGSFRSQGLVVIPCSMGTLSAISHGASDNLLERTADVMLKEGRPIILVPRETPLHAIHLENMLKLAQLGVKIIPAMPAFYHGPKTLDDIVDFLVGKVLDSMGLDHQLYKRWGETDEHDGAAGSNRTN